MNQLSVKPGGAIVYWTVSETNLDKLQAELEAIDLGSYCPGQPTKEAALHTALRHWCRERASESTAYATFARTEPLTNGFEVVLVERGNEQNVLAMLCAVGLSEAGEPEVVDGSLEEFELDTIRRDYYHHLATLSPAAVGSALAKLCTGRLRGLNLRPTGGFYWLNDSELETWAKVAAAVRSAGSGNRVYSLSQVIDGESIGAVKDALVREIGAESERIVAEVKKGDLGQAALKNRIATAVTLRRKVEKYESVIGEALTVLHEALGNAEQAAASGVAVEIGNALEGVLDGF